MEGIKLFSAQLISAGALVAFYSVAILWPLGNKSTIFATAAFGVLFLVYLCVRVSAKKDPTRRAVICLALTISLSAATVIIFHQERFSLYAVNALASAGLVLVVDLIRPIHVTIPLYVFIVVLGGLVFWEIDLDESIITIGQNGITLHVLVLYVVYFFRMLYPMEASGSRVLKYENYFFAAALFTLAVWSQGRAATVTALMILCVAAFILMGEFSGKKNYWVVLASLLVVFSNYFAPPLMGERPYSAIDRMVLNGGSDIRYEVWADYFQTLTPESLVMGNRDSNCHNIIQGYSRENCNVHSSYLRAHQVYGVSGIFVILLTIFCCFRWLAQRGEWFVMPIVLALLARVATDEAFFTGPYLFALFFIYTRVTDGVRSRGDEWNAK
jgi:hypothetical protein